MKKDQFELHCQIEEQHWWFVARRQILANIVRELVVPERSLSRQATIIDVGCGTGANLAELADQYHCVGIDTSAEAIRMAAERFPEVDFRAGYAPEDLGDCMAEAQLVMLNDVLEHVPDDFQLLSRILGAVRPGAYVLITVPANLNLWSPHDESFGHYRRYDGERLCRTWSELPADTILCSHFNSRLYPLIRLVRAWNQWRGRTDGMAGTDFKVPSAPVNNLLTRIFAGEQDRLLRLLRQRAEPTFKAGVSLIAVLRRSEGEVAERTRPEDIAADYYDPQTRQYLAVTAS